MISDIVFDALQEIEEYNEQFPNASAYERARRVLGDLLKELDAEQPPKDVSRRSTS